MSKKNIFISLLLLINSAIYCQSVAELQSSYTGTTSWDQSTGTLVFTSTGTSNFSNRELLYNNVWYVPSEVKKIIINSNVTVTGEFWCEYDCLIRGNDQYTSVVFGTPQQNYLGQDRGFSTFYASQSTARNVVLTVKNLTSLNPKVYHFTGSSKGVIHLDSCRVIDNRGGNQNNSDGYQSADGGTVKNCYFETAEDVIKAYNNITIENTTIKMIYFSVPIQCGWGDYGSGITAKFKKLTIIGNSGREPENAFIEARQGNYTKFIIIDSLTIDNPNAAMFRLQQAGSTINVNITNASIHVKKYGDVILAKGTRTICGTTTPQNNYTCSGTTAVPDSPTSLTAKAVSGDQIDLTWVDNSNNESGFKIERSPYGSFGWSQIADLPANSTGYSDTGRYASTLYYYRVYAYNAGGNSTFSNTASTTTLVTGIDNNSEMTSSLPKEYVLNQNYPNPFNPVTTIKYQIPVPGNVILKVYNALGCEINTLVNEAKAAGFYSTKFDGSNLSSGLYCLCMIVNPQNGNQPIRIVKKMMLTK